MAEVYLGMGRAESLIMPRATIATHAPEISTAAMLENILARCARIEARLIERERWAAATLPPLRPEPDPPDGPPWYAAAQPPYQPYQPPLPPYQPDNYPLHNRPWSTIVLVPPPYPILDSLTLHRNPWSMTHAVDVSTKSAPPTSPVSMPESYHCYPSPAAAAVRQPPQLRQPSSWVNMPQHQVLSSTPTYIGSAISPTATTQSRSCHGQPIAVLQPLLSPPSYCRSAAMLPVAAPPTISTVAIQRWTNLAAKKPLHSIDETRPGKGALEEDSEEEFYDMEKDPPKDLQEQVVWLKVKQYMLIEEKRPVELEIAPMQQELYGLRSALVEKNEQEDARTRIQHGLPSLIFYGNNEGSRSTIRCAFDPGGVSSPKFLFVMIFVVSWFPP